MFKTLDDLDCAGRRILLRADLNVPAAEGRVIDDARIAALAPTLRELLDKGARIIVISHFGRPKGNPDPMLSLRFLQDDLARHAGLSRIGFAEDCIGDECETAVAALGDGEALLVENLRFHAGEEANDPDFSAALARLGNAYVNDAFSVSHRAHASTEGITHLLPAFAGRSLQTELAALAAALDNPERPVLAVIGGAKVSTKLATLGNLVDKVDALAIGGGMANTFLHALGADVGASLCEPGLAAEARAIAGHADEAGCRLILPQDAIVATEFKEGAASRTVPIAGVADNEMILDIGPDSASTLNAFLSTCQTVLWNGPLGAFETAPFDAGTNAVAAHVAELTQSGDLVSVAGGGDTVAALRRAGTVEAFSYVSTAGGAFLEWLEGRELPGIAALYRDPDATGEESKQ